MMNTSEPDLGVWARPRKRPRGGRFWFAVPLNEGVGT